MAKTKSNLNKEHESFATFKRIVRYIISLRFRHGGEKITNLC